MSPVLSWARECGGPDAFVEVEVARGEEGSLESVVAALRPAGLAAERIVGAMTSSVGGTRPIRAYDAYTDRARHERVFAALRSPAADNTYVYRVMTVGDGRVWIEDGYMGGGEAELRAESTFLVALARHPAVVVVGWAVRSGGQGYPTSEVARGADGASLVAYLVAR